MKDEVVCNYGICQGQIEEKGVKTEDTDFLDPKDIWRKRLSVSGESVSLSRRRSRAVKSLPSFLVCSSKRLFRFYKKYL